jgi:hypothetical protein
MNLAYGRTTPVLCSDPEVEAVNKCLGRLGLTVKPGGNLVDTFPILGQVISAIYMYPMLTTIIQVYPWLPQPSPCMASGRAVAFPGSA